MSPELRQEKRRALLQDWINARCSLAAETSSAIVDASARVIEQAKEYAYVLDIEWSDNLVPDHIREMVAWAGMES